MACQGCGRESEAKLCCPKCVELGRTTYFCNQDCFTANWRTHNQLHELIIRQRAQANGDSTGSGARSGAAGASKTVSKQPMDPLPKSTEPLPRAQLEDLAIGGRGRRGQTPPPLPGGTPLLNHYGRSNKPRPSGQPSSAATAAGADNGKSKTAANQQGISGVLGQAWAWGQSFAASAADPKRAAAGKGRNSRSRSPPGRASKNASVQPLPASTGARARRFVQSGLGSLALLVVFGGGIYYFTFQQYTAADQPSADPAANEVPEPSSSLPPPLPLAPGLQGGNSANANIASLRSEVSALRELIERHDKMLTYVMKRYVEKDLPGQKDEGSLEGTGLVVAETFNEVAKPRQDANAGEIEQTRKDRKRRAGEEFGEDTMIGQPGLEAAVPVPADDASANLRGSSDAAAGGVGATVASEDYNPLGSSPDDGNLGMIR